jgi:hypothetical protein
MIRRTTLLLCGKYSFSQFQFHTIKKSPTNYFLSSYLLCLALCHVLEASNCDDLLLLALVISDLKEYAVVISMHTLAMSTVVLLVLDVVQSNCLRTFAVGILLCVSILESAIKSVLFQVLLDVDRVALVLHCSQLLFVIRENLLVVALEYSQLPLVECEVVLE